jgi:NitT/TauT family transport system permease protein
MAMTNKTSKFSISFYVLPLIALIIFVLAWEFLCITIPVKEYIVPAPSVVAKTFALHNQSLWTDFYITAIEAVLGFLLANLLSLITAVCFTVSPLTRRIFYPYTVALKSIPLISLAPLLVLWFGYGIVGKVFMSAIIAYFPLVVNATTGLNEIDRERLALMESLSAGKMEILMKLRFPSAMPHIFAALKISTSLAVVGAIVAELTGATRGLGFTILMASYNIDTPLLFCAIILAALIGITFFGAMCLLESTIGKKYKRSI